ncbi:MAG: twin-arginine translocation protein TatA/E family [Frankiales bacterium]|nr:twin-arginine translocation protein TatA/E family [Frankiales bacterium]
MPNLGAMEIFLIVLLIMVLFGAKRLPDASRSLGRSLRIFKAETKGLRDDDVPTTGTASAAAPIAPPAPIAPTTAVAPPAPAAVPAPLDAPGTEQSPQRQP